MLYSKSAPECSAWVDVASVCDTGEQQSLTTKVCSVCETQMTSLICAARPRTQRCPLVSRDMCSTPSTQHHLFLHLPVCFVKAVSSFPPYHCWNQTRMLCWAVYLKETYWCKHFPCASPHPDDNISPRSAAEEILTSLCFSCVLWVFLFGAHLVFRHRLCKTLPDVGVCRSDPKGDSTVCYFRGEHLMVHCTGVKM